VVGDPYQSINDPKTIPGYYGAFYPYQFNRKEADDTIYPALADITYSLGYACDYWKGNDRNQWPNNWDNDYLWVWQAWDDYYSNFGNSSNALTRVILSLYCSDDLGIPRRYIADSDEHYASTLLDDWADKKTGDDPALHLVTGSEALDAIVAAVDAQGLSFKEWQGELPNTWLYIHGPGHYQLISKMRSVQRLLPAAEMFSSFNCILDGSLSAYPESVFTDAWKKAIFPDHGMGGARRRVRQEGSLVF